MVQVHTPQTSAEVVKLTESASLDCLIALYFHTPWAEPCQQMGQAFSALAALQGDSAKSLFIAIDAEECPEVSEKYEVSAVPYTVLTNKAGETVGTVEGGDVAALRDLFGKHLPSPAATTTAANHHLGATVIPPAQQTVKPVLQSVPDAPEATANGEGADVEEEPLNERLQKLINAAPVMLFMKGTPAAPQCGFSRQVVGLLRERNVRYGFFNILADDDVRQGLKEFSNWPTYPQLYLKGELIGGLDIVSIFFPFLLLLYISILSIYQSINLSIYQSIYLSIYPSIHLSISPPPCPPPFTLQAYADVYISLYLRSRKNWKMIPTSLRTFERIVGWIGTNQTLEAYSTYPIILPVPSTVLQYICQ